jgi:DNA-binding MarR family transcriptional regulator
LANKPNKQGTEPAGQTGDDDNNIGWELYQALRAYNARALLGIRTRGHTRVTLAHAAILPHIAADGTRLTEIAMRAGMTKQSASQLVRELEHSGYVSRLPDERDRRAERIVFTKIGKQFRIDAREVKRAQETELTRFLGKDGKAKLAELLAAFPWREVFDDC